MVVHIIGGGIAGLSSAAGVSDLADHIYLYEKSNMLFSGASGRNAAIARTYEADPLIASLVRKGVSRMQKIPGLLKQNGLIIEPLEVDYTENSWVLKNPDAQGLLSREDSINLPDGNKFSGRFIGGNGTVDVSLLQKYIHNLIPSKKFTLHLQTEAILHINTIIERSFYLLIKPVGR